MRSNPIKIDSRQLNPSIAPEMSVPTILPVKTMKIGIKNLNQVVGSPGLNWVTLAALPIHKKKMGKKMVDKM